MTSENLTSAAPQVLAELFLSLDDRDYDRLTSCFVSGGVWRRQGKDLTGAAEITQALTSRPSTLITLHSVSNVAVEMSSNNNGMARFYLTVYRHDSGKPPSGPIPVPKPSVVGKCTADFVVDAGHWRIQTLKTGPYTFSD